MTTWHDIISAHLAGAEGDLVVECGAHALRRVTGNHSMQRRTSGLGSTVQNVFGGHRYGPSVPGTCHGGAAEGRAHSRAGSCCASCMR